MDFEILDEAGITQSEFAEITGASRGTVNAWCRGKSKPMRAHQKEVKRHLVLLQVAVRLHKLPGDIPKVYKGNVESRKDYIHASLKDAAAYIRTHKK